MMACFLQHVAQEWAQSVSSMRKLYTAARGDLQAAWNAFESKSSPRLLAKVDSQELRPACRLSMGRSRVSVRTHVESSHRLAPHAGRFPQSSCKSRVQWHTRPHIRPSPRSWKAQRGARSSRRFAPQEWQACIRGIGDGHLCRIEVVPCQFASLSTKGRCACSRLVASWTRRVQDLPQLSRCGAFALCHCHDRLGVLNKCAH